MSGHIYTKISQPADHSLVILKMIPMEVFRLVLEINHDCEPQVADSRCTTYKNQLRGKQREREQASEVGERLVLNRRGTIFHLQAAKSKENCLMPFFIWKPLKKNPNNWKANHYYSEKLISATRPTVRRAGPEAWYLTAGKGYSRLALKASFSVKIYESATQRVPGKITEGYYIFQAWQTMQERFVPRAIRKTEYGSNVPPVDKEHALPLYFI